MEHPLERRQAVSRRGLFSSTRCCISLHCSFEPFAKQNNRSRFLFECASSICFQPTFHLISIKLTSFKINLSNINADLTLTVHVSNPNITPIHYSSTTMSIFYDGSFLGEAHVKAGSQPPRSCRVLELPARLDGIELAHHAGKFFADVAKREMALDAKVEISGTAKMLWWEHRFKVHVECHVTVDPVVLDVIDQENESQLELFLAS